MLKVLTVVGTRPEVIKMAPVVLALQQREGAVTSRVCATAQHREMLDEALARFGLAADHDLDLMTRGQTPSRVAAAVLQALPPVLAAERPDWVLVQGDTTTTTAAAMAAALAGIRVGYVESGLRTHDLRQPFPEELNRLLATRAATLHFAPTPLARRNLLAEGVPDRSIVVTGNTVTDALHATVAALDLDAGAHPFADLPPDGRLVLVTAHRRENLGPPLTRICAALRGLVALDPRLHVVYPLHPRPEVREVVRGSLGGEPRIVLCDHLGHPALIRLMLRAELVLTDSGGMQEEAATLGRPVLVLREVTERPEAVEAGLARLVGTDPERILAAARSLLAREGPARRGARATQCYGDGRAAERIVAALLGEPVAEWVPETTALRG